MRNDVNNYKKRTIGTCRSDAFVPDDDVVQGSAVVTLIGGYKKRKIGNCRNDVVVRVRAFVPARRGRAGQRGRA